MLYNFTVELNDNDYYQFNKNHSNKSAVSKYKRSYYEKSTAVVAAAIGLITIFANKDKLFANPIVFLLCIIFYSVLVAVIIICDRKFTVFLNAQIEKEKQKDKQPRSQYITLQFFEDFVFAKDDFVERKFKYDIVKKTDIDKNAVYVYDTTYSAYVIPLRYFENQEHIDSFCDFMNRKLQEVKKSE